MPSVIGLESTRFTEKSRKWLVVPKTSQKDHTINNIDRIINETIFSESKVEKLGRSNHHNINTPLTIYTFAIPKKLHV